MRSGLVDKSLLRSWIPAEQSRYDIEEPCFGMFLSIHDYAAEKLTASGSVPARAPSNGTNYFAAFGSEEATDRCIVMAASRRRARARTRQPGRRLPPRRPHGHGDTAVGAFRAAWEVLETSKALTRSAPALGLTRCLRLTADHAVAARRGAHRGPARWPHGAPGAWTTQAA